MFTCQPPPPRVPRRLFSLDRRASPVMQTIEYAAVQSWSWNNQYNLPDPGQTFEAVLWDGGDVLFQYLDMLVHSIFRPTTTLASALAAAAAAAAAAATVAATVASASVCSLLLC